MGEALSQTILEVYEVHDGGVALRRLSQPIRLRSHRRTLLLAPSGHQAIRDGQPTLSSCIDERFFTRTTTFVDLRKRKVLDVNLGAQSLVYAAI
jgi:hypothetical protein|tara:strand:- start:1468 stop:1749 length:282 start_codon:yes stop_codon:yes gene_type:complete